MSLYDKVISGALKGTGVKFTREREIAIKCFLRKSGTIFNLSQIELFVNFHLCNLTATIQDD